MRDDTEFVISSAIDSPHKRQTKRGAIVTNLTTTDRAWIVGKLHSNIAEYFAHWEDADFSRDELDSIYKQYLTEALTADGRAEFISVLKRWIGRLHNAHSWCNDKEFKYGSRLGFQLERQGEDWIVVSSLVDEVVPGDVVEAIDGRTPQQWMEHISPFLTAKQPKARDSQWQSMLSTVWDAHTVQLRVRTRSDKNRDIEYTLIRPDAEHIRMIRKQETEGRWLSDGELGYIRIPSFNESHFEEEALEYVQKFSDAKTIIIDLRSNGGGATPTRLIDALMERPYRWWTETSPNIGYLWRRHHGKGNFSIAPDGSGARVESQWSEPSNCLFTGKVILLAGRYSGSSAEDFIMPFKDTQRGIVIGESTWGSTGQPVFFEHTGLNIGIGAIRAYLPDGTPFEGVGIAPDIAVTPSREELYSGRDVVLERAIEIANKYTN